MQTRRSILTYAMTVGVATAVPHQSQADSCAVAIDRKRFQQYLDLFNAFDPAFTQFYADDVVLRIGSRGDIKTPRAIYEFNQELRQNFTEALELEFFCSDATGVAAELKGAYRCIKDVENSPRFGRSIKKGEVRRQRGVVLYTIKNGKFTLLRGEAPQILQDWRMED